MGPNMQRRAPRGWMQFVDRLSWQVRMVGPGDQVSCNCRGLSARGMAAACSPPITHVLHLQGGLPCIVTNAWIRSDAAIKYMQARPTGTSGNRVEPSSVGLELASMLTISTYHSWTLGSCRQQTLIPLAPSKLRTGAGSAWSNTLAVRQGGRTMLGASSLSCIMSQKPNPCVSALTL